MKYLLFVLTLFISNFSFACSCVTPDIEESFENADFVYIGLIESAELNGDTQVINYVSIEQEFKGNRDTDILISDNSESSCASPAAVGYKVLIFGKKGQPPKLQSCNQTQILFSGRKEILDKLVKLKSKGLNKHDS